MDEDNSNTKNIDINVNGDEKLLTMEGKSKGKAPVLWPKRQTSKHTLSNESVLASAAMTKKAKGNTTAVIPFTDTSLSNTLCTTFI